MGKAKGSKNYSNDIREKAIKEVLDEILKVSVVADKYKFRSFNTIPMVTTI